MTNPYDRRALLGTLAAGAAGTASLMLANLSASAAGRTATATEALSAVIRPDQTHLNRQPFGDLRIYLDSATGQLKDLTLGSLELKPGQQPHPPHTHPEEEVMIVTTGHGEISLEGKVSQVGPGDVMYAASNRLHGVVNTGSEPLLFYYLKWTGK